jgi:hypothetical protein
MVFLPFETIRRCSVQSRLIDSIVHVVRRVVIHAGHRVRAISKKSVYILTITSAWFTCE